jgi:hypothetical protein
MKYQKTLFHVVLIQCLVRDWLVRNLFIGDEAPSDLQITSFTQELATVEKERQQEINKRCSLEDSLDDRQDDDGPSESNTGSISPFVREISPGGNAQSTQSQFQIPTRSVPSDDENNLKRLSMMCLELSRRLEVLPRFCDEWFDLKGELKVVTEELEFEYAESLKS